MCVNICTYYIHTSYTHPIFMCFIFDFMRARMYSRYWNAKKIFRLLSNLYRFTYINLNYIKILIEIYIAIYSTIYYILLISIKFFSRDSRRNKTIKITYKIESILIILTSTIRDVSSYFFFYTIKRNELSDELSVRGVLWS